VLTPEEELVLRVESDFAGLRLDRYLVSKLNEFSRAKIQRLITCGNVSVNGLIQKASYILKFKDVIEVTLPEDLSQDFVAENIPIDIRYEDEHIAIINKPAGMVVHPGAGITGGTLANAIAYHFGLSTEAANNENRHRVGIVHRLDKDTSGLIIVAKTDKAHEKLSEQFQMRKVEKDYIALLHGELTGQAGQIIAPIARDRRNRLRMAVTRSGKEAITNWTVKEQFHKFTLCNVRIKTGRTHQIRVHFAYINHPIVGDRLYNKGRDNTINNHAIRDYILHMNRFFLHSYKLAFRHPVTGNRISLECELPPDLEELLELIRNN
jgi:23S rRNA pseudouridine1911/1915/1917 synthase